jgi:hypothetical protein
MDEREELYSSHGFRLANAKSSNVLVAALNP